jgi:hypothetical protein
MTTREEVLGKYKQIEASDLAGTYIEHVYADADTLILITGGNLYVSLYATRLWDDAELQKADLKIDELQTMGLLTHDEWAEHLREEGDAFSGRKRQAEIKRFKDAAAKLGLSDFQTERLILESHLTNPTP